MCVCESRYKGDLRGQGVTEEKGKKRDWKQDKRN